MRIRLVSRPIAPPWDSGSMNMAYGVAVHLGKRQHKVCIPVVQGFRPSATNVIAEGVFTSRDFALRQKVRMVKHLLTAQPTDVTHFFMGTSSITAAVISLITRLRHSPTVLTLTHVPRPSKSPVVFGQRIVTYSAYLARSLRQSGIRQVVHIPPGVDEQIIHPAIDGGEAGHSLGIPTDAPVVLYGGEFGHSATLEALRNAMARCLGKRPSMHFVLACRIRSEYGRQRKNELADNLRTVPWGRNVIIREQISNMHSLIARADVCILPLRDTYGKVDIPLFLLESLAMAKPIVITDIAPLDELLQESVGLAVPVGDGIALAQAIERMVVAGQEYGARGRQLVKRRYTLRQAAQRYEELYLELLSESHSRLL